MTADTITAIKKALEGVTPGPWGYVASNENHGPYVCNDWGAGDICDGYVMPKTDSLSIRNGGDSRPINHQHDEADANMRYIAAINPEAISEILSTLESLQRENEELRKALTGLVSCHDDFNASSGNMQEAYYKLAKYANPKWQAARAALSSTGYTHGK